VLCGQQNDSEIRHGAMEALMSFVCGLVQDFCEPSGAGLLEQVVGLNIEWMLEVEEDIEVWTDGAEDDGDDDDEIDGKAVELGEENLDRLAEQFSKLDNKTFRNNQVEAVFMPTLFKVIRTFAQTFSSSWTHTRACIMAVSQVVEHIEEEAWIDQCVDFIVASANHSHSRVRFAVFHAIEQTCRDHEPYVQETHGEKLLAVVVPGIDDLNIRVATRAVSSFVSLGEELDPAEFAPHTDNLITKLFARLDEAATRSMQEQCLSAIAVVSEISEELFSAYSKHIIPVVKQMIVTRTAENERTLRGKAFECFSLVASAVGKENSAADCHEVMQIIVPLLQAGLPDDDPTREYIQEASGRIATTLEQDFKPYLPALLPVIFQVLGQRPKELNPEDLSDDDSDDEERDMSLLLSGDKVVGLKTSVLEEMKNALALINTLIKAVDKDFCEFFPKTCENLLPLLDFELSEVVREKTFQTWEVVAEMARTAADQGAIQLSDVRNLVGEFLKTTVAAMAKAPQAAALDEVALGALQAQAMGVGGVISKAGKGVLAQDEVTTIVNIVVQLLGQLSVSKDEPTEAAGKKRKGKEPKDDDDDSVLEDIATRQSARFCLADIAGSLMRSNADEFVAVGLAPFMEVVQRFLLPDAIEADRSLALYIADDVVELLAERSIPCWNTFMEPALRGLMDKSAVVRQYAASTIGNGARHAIFAQMAPAAATALAQILTKQGERHRRRRAAKNSELEGALALDSCILALGRLLEFQEPALGAGAPGGWKLWLTNLPLRYDQEEGQKAHRALLDLVVRSHPVVTSAENLPKVLGVFGEIYHGSFSNATLDADIVKTVAAAAANVRQVIAGLPEKQVKKIEMILKDGGQGMGDTTDDMH